MSLALEEERRRAEETLTLLAAAQTQQEDLELRLAAALMEHEETQAALAATETQLERVETTREELEARLAAALAEREETAAELEQERARAESDRDALRRDLAAALAARRAAESEAAEALSEAEQRAELLATAERLLQEEREVSAESQLDAAASQRRAAALSEQIAALRRDVASLQSLLDDAVARDVEQQVQIEALGSRLNAALARVASEERRRAELEEAERRRLEEEARQLESYRSEFFGRMREILAGFDGVSIVGDRFVFSSEVLFELGSAELAEGGRSQIGSVVELLRAVSEDIPDEIDWIVRIDGHTDNLPLAGGGEFADNWELSQGRALSVVRYMVEELAFPPDRLAAAGFGEYRPVASNATAQGRAQNRRIELKLTER